jgi:hypothetical protein
MPSVGAVELRVTVKCIKILIVAQQCFCGKFASPATINLKQVFKQNIAIFTVTSYIEDRLFFM